MPKVLINIDGTITVGNKSVIVDLYVNGRRTYAAIGKLYLVPFRWGWMWAPNRKVVGPFILRR